MNLLRDSNICTESWNRLISESTYTSAFQTPAFYELFNSVSGLSANAFAIEDGFELKALCVVTLQKETGLKSYFSRRAIIYGGPVLKDNKNVNYLEYLLNSLSNEFIKRSIYIEIRNLNNYSVFKEVLKRIGWQYIPYQNFKVDCTDKEKLFKKLGSNRKRQIKRALDSGVEIKEVENIDEINAYYYILRELYKKKIKKPLLPQEFFIEFFYKDFGKSFIVKYKSKIIGGIVCPILKDKTIYELYVCGLDEEYKDQHPSVMATWAAMNYANTNQIPVFDFMGAGRKDQDYGVRDFKARFGGEPVEYGRYLKINNPSLYKIGEIGLKLLKVLNK